MLISDIALADLDVTTTVKVSQKTQPKLTSFLQRAVDHGDAIARRINQDVSLHASQDLLNP
jgi:hypothetical protein